MEWCNKDCYTEYVVFVLSGLVCHVQVSPSSNPGHRCTLECNCIGSI